MAIKCSQKWGIGLGLACLLSAVPAQASITLDFSTSGSTTGDSGFTGLMVGNVYDGATSESIGSVNVPIPDVTTLTYLIPYSTIQSLGLNAQYLQYGWIAYYNSTGTTLLDLVHFDNSTTYNSVLCDTMFIYSNPSGQISSTVLNSILNYQYLVKIDQNSNGSFPLYTPATTLAGGYTLNASSALLSYQLVPEPSTYMAGALILLPFGASALRMARKKQAA